MGTKAFDCRAANVVWSSKFVGMKFWNEWRSTGRNLLPVKEIEQVSESGEHVGIVGGGLLGLTLALRLAQRGKRVTILEAADHVGGLADAWQIGDIKWDRHYHVTLLSDRHLRGILKELGLDEQMCW